MQKVILFICTLLCCKYLNAQLVNSKEKFWHNIERELRYQPIGNDIVITNGKRRFTRALYGTNTAFRVEAGDLPEFAMYMPGMGGNIKFGITNSDSSKWLINAHKITARYRAGSMIYEIEDKILGKGILHIEVLAMGNAEGIIIKLQSENVPNDVKLTFAYGGASGKKFSRDGDMGPDPESSFYLKPENCTDNNFTIENNNFLLQYGTGVVAEWDPYVNKNFSTDTVKPIKIGKEQQISGSVPNEMPLYIADAAQVESPEYLLMALKIKSPIIVGQLNIENNKPYYFALQKVDSGKKEKVNNGDVIFVQAENARKKIADRIVVKTPDKFLNTLGGVISIAADAVWDSPTFMHGAIGWRMRLNGWRGPYVGDVLGWHDRAKTHFDAYAASQLKTPLTGPIIMDTALHLARSLEKLGTSIFSNGYICRNPNGDFRPHHYDMNLVYIDALLRHLKWTGDLQFAKKMWPVIASHLAWEKRNFDTDNDGLYDAYAAIWASDALQYSGGAVTHSSAYNYKANKEAALIAKLIGEDGTQYEAEATKILNAINNTLWLANEGTYAEFKDLLGNQLLHKNSALWSIYHSLDSDVPNAFQAYQSLKYIDENIPHIPVKAKGIEDGYFTLSTSNWMPYDWSLNNVATAEVMHTALAQWQGGQNDKAFHLFKSELLSTMYLGGSAGNIGQISFYDAARSEAYRDFADPVAMTARSLIEGLFGILPDALQKTITIKPGFPKEWNFASIATPDIKFDFKRNGKKDTYSIQTNFKNTMALNLLVKANGATVQKITVNGEKVNWKNVDDAINNPLLEINIVPQKKYLIVIEWKDKLTTVKGVKDFYLNNENVQLQFPNCTIQDVFDPHKILNGLQKKKSNFNATLNATKGSYSFFVQVKQNEFIWWQAIDINVKEPIVINASFSQPKNGLQFNITNNTTTTIEGKLVVNSFQNKYTTNVQLKAKQDFVQVNVPSDFVIAGSNAITFSFDKKIAEKNIINWNVETKKQTCDAIDITKFFNDKVTQIFKNQYLSPRPTVATLQLPTQGIGDWTHPLKTANIDDKGLRKMAGGENKINLPQGISFNTPSDTLLPNILFTSQWDNYPKEAIVPLSGSAAHIYLLMAGSTNPMQSRMVNGAVIVNYMDNTADTLLLKNPENWWPIEQDYMDDGFAFTTDAAKPIRIHLKTGKIVSELDNSMKTYAGKIIDGGAATVVDLPLNKAKVLKELKLQTIANDVVIGLMAITLIR